MIPLKKRIFTSETWKEEIMDQMYGDTIQIPWPGSLNFFSSVIQRMEREHGTTLDILDTLKDYL